MRKTLIAIAIALAIVASIIYIASLPAATIAITQDELDQAYDANGGVITRQIEVSSGDKFRVNLYAHWSSGMKWSVSYDRPGIVRQDGARELVYDSLPLFGSPSHEEWIFKALAEGEAAIILTYGSVANLPDAPRSVNTLIIKVKVK